MTLFFCRFSCVFFCCLHVTKLLELIYHRAGLELVRKSSFNQIAELLLKKCCLAQHGFGLKTGSVVFLSHPLRKNYSL